MKLKRPLTEEYLYNNIYCRKDLVRLEIDLSNALEKFSNATGIVVKSITPKFAHLSEGEDGEMAARGKWYYCSDSDTLDIEFEDVIYEFIDEEDLPGFVNITWKTVGCTEMYREWVHESELEAFLEKLREDKDNIIQNDYPSTTIGRWTWDHPCNGCM